MEQTTFEVDDTTAESISELKRTFEVKTNAQVIRKSLALARTCAKYADPQNAIVIITPDNKLVKVILSK